MFERFKTHLNDNKKNNAYVESLPTYYVVALWARWGIMEVKFSGRYKTENGVKIPLVWQWDDHNGTYKEWILRDIRYTTTGFIKGWYYNKADAEVAVKKAEDDSLKTEQAFQAKVNDIIKEKRNNHL